MDRIRIPGLVFYGYHGALAEENVLGQRFTVSLVLELDLRPAGKSDDLKQTVNYCDLIPLVRAIVERRPPFKLIERLAEMIAEEILGNFEKVMALTVEVIKSNPPVPEASGGVVVEIYRSRNGTT